MTSREAFRRIRYTSSEKCSRFSITCKTPRNYVRFQGGKVHTLTGDRKGTWSLSVTRNRRLTFSIDIGEREIYEVNLEDYH